MSKLDSYRLKINVWLGKENTVWLGKAKPLNDYEKLSGDAFANRIMTPF